MRARDAAPGARDSGAAETTQGNGRIIAHPLPDRLPPAILARLRAEGIDSCESWLALSARQRRMLFGVTPARCAEIDAAVREAIGART